MTVTKTDKTYYRRPVYLIQEAKIERRRGHRVCAICSVDMGDYDSLNEIELVTFDGIEVYEVKAIDPYEEEILVEMLPIEPVYDKFTEYVISHVGSVDKVSEFKFWMDDYGKDYYEVFQIYDNESLWKIYRLGFSRYDYKCIAKTQEGRSYETYASDFYEMVKEHRIVPYEEGDHIEKFVYERLNGGFVERFEEKHVVDKNGEIKM